VTYLKRETRKRKGKIRIGIDAQQVINVCENYTQGFEQKKGCEPIAPDDY
jgi:hypothetical protein